jgi:hypothetical protein
MPVISKTKPDSTYYGNIVQYDNGDWAADPLPLDDFYNYPAIGGYAGTAVPGGYGTPGQLFPGLRTTTGKKVASFVFDYINSYAPQDYQRNSLHIMATLPTSDPSYAPAKAMMDWVNAMNAWRDTEIAYVKTLNFNQIIAYIIRPGWPPPPAGLTPIPPVQPGSATAMLRFG